jgi:hypothetical protein
LDADGGNQLMTTSWRSIATTLEPEARRELLAALLAPEGTLTVAPLPQYLVATTGDCLEREHIVPQWTEPDGTLRGVVIRALRFEDRMLAEVAATVYNPKTKRSEVNPWRLMAEEVARGTVKPQVTVDHVLKWNDDVVRNIYAAIHDLAPYPPARVAAEIARHAGGDAPEPPGGGGDAPADESGGDGGGAAGNAPS